MTNVRLKEMEYIKYIQDHIINVKKAWKNMKSNPKCVQFLKDNLNYTHVDIGDYFRNTMDIKIENHDKSKWNTEEFGAYRRNFYPVDDMEKKLNEDEFDKAWTLHYSINDHHWEYWYFIEKDIDRIPTSCIIEMACDWIAMGYKFNNDALSFYNKNKNEIKIGKEPLKILLGLLKAFYGK